MAIVYQMECPVCKREFTVTLMDSKLPPHTSPANPYWSCTGAGHPGTVKEEIDVPD